LDEIQAAEAIAAVQRWMALDLWVALGGASADFALAIEAHGFSDVWAYELSLSRNSAMMDLPHSRLVRG
jgi:hypothetical protein